MPDFNSEYRSMSDGEILRLYAERDQLRPEARESLELLRVMLRLRGGGVRIVGRPREGPRLVAHLGK